jgi:CheY-like chemotaxis protein
MTEAKQPYKAAKLLIVEDHPITRCAMESMLEELRL